MVSSLRHLAESYSSARTCVAVYFSALQCVAVCCSALHWVASVRDLLRRHTPQPLHMHTCHEIKLTKHCLLSAVCRSMLQRVLQSAAVRCSVLQCAALRCSMSQQVAACCSVLQSIAVRGTYTQTSCSFATSITRLGGGSFGGCVKALFVVCRPLFQKKKET